MEAFTTIFKDETVEIVERKSRFIANICYVENVDEAERRIREIKRKYYDAKHNCIAYRLIENSKIIEKSSDDGEPSGTAGGPMLNILKKNNICNVVVVVTRYFGGILLGTGGLVRAYSEATKKVIEKSVKLFKVEGKEIKIKLDYSNFESFKYYCRTKEINITNVEYFEDIILKIEMENSRMETFLKDIETKTLNIKEIQVIGEKYINKTVEKNK